MVVLFFVLNCRTYCVLTFPLKCLKTDPRLIIEIFVEKHTQWCSQVQLLALFIGWRHMIYNSKAYKALMCDRNKVFLLLLFIDRHVLYWVTLIHNAIQSKILLQWVYTYLQRLSDELQPRNETQWINTMSNISSDTPVTDLLAVNIPWQIWFTRALKIYDKKCKQQEMFEERELTNAIVIRGFPVYGFALAIRTPAVW